MNVLFAHSFFMAFDEKQRLVREPYPPLGTLIAAACAREAGHQVALFDAMIADSVDDFIALQHGADGPFQAVVLFEDNFNWLSKMCLNRMRKAAARMIAAAKKAGSLTIVAGSDASDYPEIFLKVGADYVVKGEAEFQVTELLDRHAAAADGADISDGPPSGLPGVFTLRDSIVLGTPPERGVRDLTQFPAAAWDLVDMDAYREIWRAQHGFFALNMMTTRGCPYRCNWCAKPIHGRRYDVRDPAHVARELASLKTRFAPDLIWFTDDIFGLKPGWVAGFADEVARLDARVPFKIQARADLIKPAYADALARAGCASVWMGVESGSNQVLKAMDKDLTVADTDRATALLQERGIEVCYFLQFGYPGESGSDIRETWRMIARNRPSRIGVSVAYPLPGTPFFERVKDQLPPDKDHWEHSQDMRPLHRATYPKAFYPALYAYVHAEFRALKAATAGRGVLPGMEQLKSRARVWRERAKIRRFGVEGVPFQ